MKDLSELRELLGETMREVKGGKLDLDRARVIAELGGVITAGAKAECDMVRATDGGYVGTGFFNACKK